MSIDFIDSAGSRPKARRQISGGTVLPPGASDAEVARAISDLTKRVSEMEAARNPDAIEFEVNLPASGTVVLEHGFNGPVRYYVTHWKETSQGTAPTA